MRRANPALSQSSLRGLNDHSNEGPGRATTSPSLEAQAVQQRPALSARSLAPAGKAPAPRGGATARAPKVSGP